MALDGQAMIFHQFLLLRAFRQMSTQDQISPWWYPSICFQNAKASFSNHLLICGQHVGSPWSVLSFLALLDLFYYTQGLCLLFSQPQLIIFYYWTHEEDKYPWQELLPIQALLWVPSWRKGSEVFRDSLLEYFSTRIWRIWTSFGCVLQGDSKNVLPCLP